MAFLPQVLFAVALGVAVYLFIKSVKRLAFNINLGKDFDRTDRKPDRLKQMLLVAFGQKKMFKKPIPAILHLFVYVGFLVVNIELLEIVLDGLLGTHRLFEPVLGSLYPVLINVFEFFAVAVLLACVVFLIRRNVIKINRFQSKEMTAWPKLDANIILLVEIFLMIALLSMNATDTVIRRIEGVQQSFFFSDLMVGMYSGMSLSSLQIAERSFWWIHVLGIFTFANYVLYSKHLHIFLAFPNTYYSNLEAKGKIENMPVVTNEVKLMLGMPADQSTSTEVARFGAKDVVDLSKKSLLDAYSCTECGRCTSNCPANITGKLLSPRKIMMDTRDRAEELGELKRKNGNDFTDDKSLLGNYISDEEIFACTSCNACVEACPVNIDPLSIILELRRYKVMEEATGPAEWNAVYQNIETSFSPWKFPPTDRFKWADQFKKS